MIYSFPGASHLLTPTQAWDQTHTGGNYIPSPQGTCASLYKLPAGAEGFLKKVPNPGEAAQPMLEFLSERVPRKLSAHLGLGTPRDPVLGGRF